MTEVLTHEDKESSVEVYELGYHLVPSLGENDLALRVGELQKRVGGSILAEGYPELIPLAYTMRKLAQGKWEKFDNAYFGWMKFEVSQDNIPVLKKELDQNEVLLRYLLIKTVREETFVPYSLSKRDDIPVEPVGEPLVRKSEEPTTQEKPNEELLDKRIDELVS